LRPKFILDYFSNSLKALMVQSESTILPGAASFMKLALEQARRAREQGEVPVGAVVVHNCEIIGSGYNQREKLQSPIAHAEIFAIENASQALGTWRLTECDLYVTLEPCIMCAGAILQARLRRVVFGCLDPKAGAVVSLYRLCEDPRLNHQVPVVGRVLTEQCAILLSEFFVLLREKKQTRQSGEVAEPG
jgi:tRNA(adenine34) deaminase